MRGIHVSYSGKKLLIQVSLCYILKDLEDRKAWYVHIYYTWYDILIFKLHRRTRLTPRSSIHSLKIRMTSHPCTKYEHTMVSYLLSVKYKLCAFPVRMCIIISMNHIPVPSKAHPYSDDSRAWESPKEADIVWEVFFKCQISKFLSSIWDRFLTNWLRVMPGFAMRLWNQTMFWLTANVLVKICGIDMSQAGQGLLKRKLLP